MARVLTWTICGLVVASFTAVALLPAAWVAVPLERITSQRLTLADPQGTLWHGSAYLGTASASTQLVTPLLPGRFSWRVSPTILVGRMDVAIENADALAAPVWVTGTWTRWHIAAAAVSFPADALPGLGAPFNTISPAGRVRLSWTPLELAYGRSATRLEGALVFDIDDVSSRLSPIKPLGAYRLTMHWQGVDARMVLETKRGPMLLSGAGALANGRWSFAGSAEAAAGYDERLGNFLNLLGDTRRQDERKVIAIQLQ